MSVQFRSSADRARPLPFVIASALLHGAVLFAHSPLARAPLVEFKVPDSVEFGLIDELDPGAPGAPPPAAAAQPVSARPERQPTRPRAEPEPVAAPDRTAAVPVDAGVACAHDADTPEEPEPAALASAAGDASGQTAAPGGDGQSPDAFGEGLGFGKGGFGSGAGGPLGAIIALHADLDRIRATSLILETEALLGIIPEWQRLLHGSGLDPLHDFARVFVATPSLRRSQVVVSARLRGGEDALARAALQLARERGQQASARVENGVKLWPWHDRGPTERVAGLFSADQFVIARPVDVARVVAASAALERRHAAEPGMERAQGASALLAMYEGEAVALSVEGVRQFLSGDATHAPTGLRISLRHVDEYHAKMRAFAYYPNEPAALAAIGHAETLRGVLAEHPRAQYLGLRSAIAEATFAQRGSTVTVDALLTLHQTRYLLGFVSRALAPRE